MSTITSSAINKTGKTVAPKAVARRRPGDRRLQGNVSATTIPTPESTQNASQDAGVDAPVEAEGTKDREEQGTPRKATKRAGRGLRKSTDSASTSGHELESTIPLGHDSVNLQGTGAEDQARALPDVPPANSTTVDGGATSGSRTSRPVRAVRRKAPAPVAGTKRKRITKKANDLQTDSASHADGANRESTTTEITTRGDANVQHAPQQATGDDTAPAAKKPRRGRKSKAVQSDGANSSNISPTDTPIANQPKKPAKPRASRIRKTQSGAESANVAAAGTSTQPDSEQPLTRSQEAPAKRTRRPRKSRAPVEAAATPEEPHVPETVNKAVDSSEEKEIDVATTKMSALTRNKAIGKTSERGKLMQAIDWSEVARKRREQSPPRPDAQTQPNGGTIDEQAPTPRRQTMQLRIVNGEIAIDESSQQVDRHAQAIQDAENMAVDENADLTKRVNRMTWINDKRRDPVDRVTVFKLKSDPWNDADTDRFYDALRMFGTDFFIISKMFPPKTRRQIKLKFIREERLDPDRINLALSGGQMVPMDLKHYASATGVEESVFKDPSSVTEELKREATEQEEEIEKRKAEVAEAQKQREIMNEQRDKEKEDRDKEKAAQKQQRDATRKRKRTGRGNEVTGSGTF